MEGVWILFYILYRAVWLNMDNIVVKPLLMELCLLSHRIATALFLSILINGDDDPGISAWRLILGVYV